MFRMILALVMALSLGSGAAVASSYEDALNSARLGDTRQLVQLLNRGIDPNTVDEQGNTLLILAAREGHADTVSAILKYRPKLGQRNPAGDSALMMATLKGHADVVDRLLEAGAPVNHDGWTPLMYAAFEGHLAILERLLASDADVNALAPNRSNALMLAARNGHRDIVRRLLQTDVDLDQKNDAGYTVESWALVNGNTDIAGLIQAERKRRASAPPSLRIEIK
jgi:ankyrin repeat protein